MSRYQGPSSLKRKRPESNSPSQSLTDHERKLYDVIRSKQDMAIWTRDLKRETNLPDNIVTKSLKALIAKNLIKEVVNIRNKGRKHYMATDFQPAKELTGGSWYDRGMFDAGLVEALKMVCLTYFKDEKVATVEGIADYIRGTGISDYDLTQQQVQEILRTLVLSNEIMKETSNGMGDFASIPTGKVCYKLVTKAKTGAMASIPCGVCPRISHCTPDGIISPKTCVYYTKWLDF